MADIKAMLVANVQKYAGRRMAKIYVLFRPRIDFGKVKPEDTIFTIMIKVFAVSDDGPINTSIADVWSLIIWYTSAELLSNKFSIAELTQMIKIAASKKIVTDLGGISITGLKQKIARRQAKNQICQSNYIEADINFCAFTGSCHAHFTARDEMRQGRSRSASRTSGRTS